MRSAQLRIGLVLTVLMTGVVAIAQETSTPENLPEQSTSQVAPREVPPSSTPATTIPGVLTSPISAGDIIDYSVYGVPEMTQRTRIDSGGNVYLPLLGSVQLSGLTTEQAQKKLEDLLVSGGFLKNPHVNISVAEYANGISLLGEVVRPGIYPVAGPRRLYDVLAAAGGLTPNAGNKITIAPKDSTKSTEI